MAGRAGVVGEWALHHPVRGLAEKRAIVPVTIVASATERA